MSSVYEVRGWMVNTLKCEKRRGFGCRFRFNSLLKSHHIHTIKYSFTIKYMLQI